MIITNRQAYRTLGLTKVADLKEVKNAHKHIHPDLCLADFDDFDEDILGSDDLFNIPTMEEMLVMFDVLFGSSSQKFDVRANLKKAMEECKSDAKMERVNYPVCSH
ncbi:hypothetical protein Plhal703r1_c26g0107711 [Plasmopara halstedii]